MSKQHNIGRKSHVAQEAELQQNMPSIDQEMSNQPTRPSVHGRHISQRSKKEPPIKPSRRHKPTRIM